ncbi:hypothetical protein ABTP66_19725, partial [Acinetobacter baumannii]
ANLGGSTRAKKHGQSGELLDGHELLCRLGGHELKSVSMKRCLPRAVEFRINVRTDVITRASA